MRYCGISLLRRLASVTIALWPAVPTGGVPQRMSLGVCDQAAEAKIPSSAAAATDVKTCLRMGVFLSCAQTIRETGVVSNPQNAAPRASARGHNDRQVGRNSRP